MNKILLLFKNKTITILAAVLVANIALISYLGYQTYYKEKPVEAIDFKTLTEDEIKDWYSQNFESKDGLKFEYEYNDLIEEGKIISQSVKPGENIGESKEITIVISNGHDPDKEIKLPNFVKEKYTKDKIEKFFNDNYFSDVNFEYKVSSEPKDTVINVNVENKAKRNQLILITLSAGESDEEIEIEVPDFKDYSLKNAKAWGNSNSVTIRINYVFSNNFPEGKIISQSVKAGLTVNPGYRIDLQVSMGKGITVKDLTNETKNDAIKWIESNKLNYRLIFEFNDKIDDGKIIYTEPKAGSMIAEGEKVILHISKGKDPDLIEVKVDSKKGSSIKDFETYIKGLGLNCYKKGSSYDDEIGENLVLSNDTGNFRKNKSVGYTVSLGKFSLDIKAFQNKNISEADHYVSQNNALNAGIIFATNKVHSETVEKNVLFNCSANGNKVTCDLSLGKKPIVSINNYIGQVITESSFTDVNGVKYEVIFDDYFTDNTKYGQIYDQSAVGEMEFNPGLTITLKAYKGEEEKGYIELNPDAYNCDSIEETANRVNTVLGKFNPTISYKKHPSLGRGKIISITATYSDGTAITSSGYYPYSAKIHVVICEGREDN